MWMWIPYESNECTLIVFTALSISGMIIFNFGVPRLRTSPHFLDFQKFSVTWHRSLRGHDRRELILSACGLVRKKSRATDTTCIWIERLLWLGCARLFWSFLCSLTQLASPLLGAGELKRRHRNHNLEAHFNKSTAISTLMSSIARPSTSFYAHGTSHKPLHHPSASS